MIVIHLPLRKADNLIEVSDQKNLSVRGLKLVTNYQYLRKKKRVS